MIPLPLAFCNRIQMQYPDDYIALKQSLESTPISAIRMNPYKKSKALSQDEIPWCEGGYYLQERPLFTADPLFHAGVYYVQDASSMVISYLFKKFFDSDEPHVFLDVCAAPGGKTTLLMSLLNINSYVISNEIVPLRASILTENVIKWGLGNAFVTNNDPVHFSKLKNHFDGILLDAPCSGEGLFRKDHEARQEWSESNCNQCVQRQEKIIHDCWDSLKPGGILFYSTCTFNAEENEKLLFKVQEELGFESLSIEFPTAWNIREVREGSILGYQFFPHLLRGEGFFISVLKKPGTGVDHANSKFAFPSTVKEKLLAPILGKEHQAVLFKEQVHALNAVMFEDFTKINKLLNLKYVGVDIGAILHGKLVPSHSLALSAFLHLDSFEKIELSREQSLLYLSRKEFVIENKKIGWKLLTFENHALGFAKHLGNRWNNYYPLQWRIRMDLP